MQSLLSTYTNIQKIISVLSHKNRIVQVKKNGLISLNSTTEPECFMIHDGYTLLRRADNNLIVHKIVSPAVFGFNKYQNASGEFYLEAMTDVAFEIVPASDFFHTISQENLWESLLDVMMSISAELFRQTSSLSVRDSFSIICSLLKELIAEPDFIRHTTTASDYIQQRTHLSRSGIMKHLAILRKKELIEMDNGLLLAVKNLPLASTKN